MILFHFKIYVLIFGSYQQLARRNQSSFALIGFSHEPRKITKKVKIPPTRSEMIEIYNQRQQLQAQPK